MQNGFMQIANNMILHIMPEDKFNDMAIRQFETAVSGIHEFWILTTNKQLIYTRSSCVKISNPKEIKKEFLRHEILAVFFHSLQLSWYPLLDSIPKNKKVFWFGWGYDYYFMLPHNLYLPKTIPYTLPTLKSALRSGIKKSMQLLGIIPSLRFESLRRIDYFSPVLDVEFQMVTTQIHQLSEVQYICWNYGTAEDDLSISGAVNVTGDNILAGNSASTTNNHIDLFHTLKEQVNLSGRSVIVPLSYGDKKYRDKILLEGKKILGNHFVPLTEYMTKDAYIETIRSCGFVTMNHLRQQAVGNVLIAMLMGAKVYLNKNNPLHNWLCVRGAHIGNMETLDMIPLALEQQEQNRNIIYSHWGRDAQAEKTKNIINCALKARNHNDTE